MNSQKMFLTHDAMNLNQWQELLKHSTSTSSLEKFVAHILSDEMPHTATACFVRNQLSQNPWIIVATADPCK